MSRFWKYLPKDRVRTAVLHFLRPGGNPDVWFPAGWSRRPSGYRTEESCSQNRESLPGQILNTPSIVSFPCIVHVLKYFFSLFLAEMESKPDHSAGDLSCSVHPAGLLALCCSAYSGFSGGGAVESAGVGLLCCHHSDHGGLWRLCCRYLMFKPITS